MIIGFFGNMSSGKTLLAVKNAYEDSIKMNKRVISNIKLNFDHIKLDTEELIIKSKSDPYFFNNSILLVDEIHNIIDARRSSSLLNTEFTLFLTQIGKLEVNPILYTSQIYESQIDLRMRAFTDREVFCERFEIRNNRVIPVMHDTRITNNPIMIKMIIRDNKMAGEKVLIRRGNYIPKQEDYDRYDTFELVMIDRQKFMRR